MLNHFTKEVISAASNAGTVLSAAIDADYLSMITAQASFTDDAAAGTLKIQASNIVNPGASDWVDVPDATASVASGVLTMTPILDTPFCYKWLRVVFTHSGGAGTLTVTAHGNGP